MAVDMPHGEASRTKQVLADRVTDWSLRLGYWMTLISLPLGGWIAAQLSDFGRDVDPALMIVVAQVLPVMLLAASVEVGLVIQRILREQDEISDRIRTWIARLGRLYFFAFVLGEGTALYAIAKSETTTFTVVTPLLVMVMFLLDITGTTTAKLGLRKTAVEILPERARKVQKHLIEQYRRRADALEAELDPADDE